MRAAAPFCYGKGFFFSLPFPELYSTQEINKKVYTVEERQGATGENRPWFLLKFSDFS